MMIRIPGLLSPDELARARALLADGPWTDGRATAGPQAAAVKRNRQLPVGSEAARALQALVLPALDRSALLFSATLPRRVLPPMFNRYDTDAPEYGNHVDQAIRHLPGTRQGLRTDISCTVFLAEPHEYDGGELVVEHGFGCERVKLPAGDAVVYPASSVHRVEPVTRGARLAGFFWIESMVRGDEQRRLLFELDSAITRLRERDGESAEAVALTGTYHNLLRLWADC